MLHRAGLSVGERVLITGASGGVGSAAVELAKRRGAEVLAVAGNDKAEAVAALGADLVIPRGKALKKAIASDSLDLVVDLEAGLSMNRLAGPPEARRAIRGSGYYSRADSRT